MRGAAALLWPAPFLVLIFQSACLSIGGSWSDADYARHNPDNYADGRFTRPIDFRAFDAGLLNAAVFYEMNRARVAAGLVPLKYSAVLQKIAAQHSRDMVDHDFFGHDSPVTGRSTLEERMERVGMRGSFASQNVAWAFGLDYDTEREAFSPEQNGGYWSYSYRGAPIPARTYQALARFVVDFWMNSPADRANLLNEGYQTIGVGSVVYWKAELPAMPHVKCTANFAGRGL